MFHNFSLKIIHIEIIDQQLLYRVYHIVACGSPLRFAAVELVQRIRYTLENVRNNCAVFASKTRNSTPEKKKEKDNLEG